MIKIDRNGEDMVTYRIWKRLMTLANPKMSKNQIDLLMLILDMNRSGHIGLCDILMYFCLCLHVVSVVLFSFDE